MNRANLVRTQPRHGYLENEEFGSDIPFAACRDVTRVLIVQSRMFDRLLDDLKYYRT